MECIDSSSLTTVLTPLTQSKQDSSFNSSSLITRRRWLYSYKKVLLTHTGSTPSNRKARCTLLLGSTLATKNSKHFYNELVEYKLILDKEQSVGPTKQVKLGFLIGLVPRESLWC
ncbi:unnamed protein product [Brassica rapa]|uniref:Uncharacterized protein n=1 Tax=Brassica campestris TaxID=3711 RepID=A0A3P5YE25_BRACM|nr:unnamed protein product [Brassica rapa]VDC62024.1 unnamed protein product [Brassica rapa]